MKIYEVSHIGEDDNTKHRFFSVKADAKREYNRLAKIDKGQILDADLDDMEDREVKCLFDLHEFEVEISKAGILEMLNSRFKES